MNRAGYDDECDYNTLGLYRGAVDRALQGKRGQAFLREALAVLDAMDVKELAENAAFDEQGRCCTLGQCAKVRGDDLQAVAHEMDLGAEDYEFRPLAKRFNIAESMVREIMYINDDPYERRTPAERWVRVRAWIMEQLKTPPTPEPS